MQVQLRDRSNSHLVRHWSPLSSPHGSRHRHAIGPLIVMAGFVPAIPATAVPAVSYAIFTSHAGGDGRVNPQVKRPGASPTGHDGVATSVRHNENCWRDRSLAPTISCPAGFVQVREVAG